MPGWQPSRFGLEKDFTGGFFPLLIPLA